LRYTWRARRVYKDLGQEPDIAQCELMIVRLSLEDGRPDLARRTLARAMRRLHRAGTAWLVTQGRFLCGVVRGSSGGVCSLRGALRRADRLGFRDLSWRTRLAAGRILWEDNRKAEAVPHVRRAMEVLRDLNRELPAEHQQPFLLDPDKQRLRLLLHRLLPHMELQNR